MKTALSPSQPLSAGRHILGVGFGQWIVLFIAWLIVMFAGYSAYQRFTAPAAPAPKGVAVPVQRGSISATVNTTGSVVAGTAAKVSFKSSGRLAEVLVQVGDSVKAGQPLAKLDTTDLQFQLTQARAQLTSAEAKLAQIQQGSRAEEIKAAETNLASAKAKLALLQAGPTDAELQAAQASVASAKAGLASGQAKLQDLLSQPKQEDVRAAELALEAAKNSLWSTQIDRDGTCGPGRPQYQCDAANAKVAGQETAVNSKLADLARAKQPAKPYDVASAREAVASAQANYDSSVAKLEQVRAGATTADLTAGQASVDSANRDLALKRSPSTEADIKSAQAAVEQNKAGFALAEYNLNNTTLVAPFAGTVAALSMNSGEIVGGSSTIQIVDPKAVRVDATVDESDVARLQVGQAVEMTFDSLTGRTFTGKVIAVAPSGTVQQGVVTYLVSLSVNDVGVLRPGMTANANITYARKDNVLMVPNRAVRAQGRDRTVDVVNGAGSVSRIVQVGMANDQMTEITAGLEEGDTVLIQSTSTIVPRGVGGMPGMSPGGGTMIIAR